MQLKFSVLSTNLSQALAAVGRAVPSRATMPITQNVLIETHEGSVRLSATDLNISIQTSIGAMIEQEGATTVPFSTLYDIVRSFPDDRVDFDIGDPDGDTKNTILTITCQKSTGRLNTSPADSFPPITPVSDGTVYELPAPKVENAISKVKLATAADDTRPVLKGINVKMSQESKSIVFAAADGFRLSVIDTPVDFDIEDDKSFIIPREAMDEVERLCSRNQQKIKVIVPAEPGHIQFQNDTTTVISQLIQGVFPNYEQLIPDSFNTRITIDKKKFNQGIAAASALAKDTNSTARFLFTTSDNPDEEQPQPADQPAAEPTPDTDPPQQDEEQPAVEQSAVEQPAEEQPAVEQPAVEQPAVEQPPEVQPAIAPSSNSFLTIEANSPEVGEYSTQIEILNCQGTDNRVAINVRYLTDLDRQIKEDAFLMDITDNSSPVAFRNLNNDEIHVVMPMQVNWQ